LDLNVALRLRIYYHDDPNPASLAADLAAMRTFLNAYDLSSLPPGDAHSGIYDPGTNTANIAGICPYGYSSPGGGIELGFIGGNPTPSDYGIGHSFVQIVRLTDFLSSNPASEMTMQVGRYIIPTGPADFTIRTYETFRDAPHLGGEGLTALGCISAFPVGDPITEQSDNAQLVRLIIDPSWGVPPSWPPVPDVTRAVGYTAVATLD